MLTREDREHSHTIASDGELFSSPMLTREDREHSHTIASDGELFAYLIPYQNLLVTSQIVLFVVSNKDLIATSTVFLTSPALLDTSLDGGDCLQRWTLRDDLVAG